MKRAWVALSLVFLSIGNASAQSAVWLLAGFIDGNPDRTIRVAVERSGDTTTIRSFDGGRVVGESVLDENGNPFSYRTFAGGGAAPFEATVGGGRRIAARSGGREWNIKSQNAIVLSDSLARMFWLHVYRYWFSAEDFRFLAYEGRMADNRISRTENNPAN